MSMRMIVITCHL